MLVNSLVTSRLDYCNGLLVNLPAKSTHRLQLAQNNAARLITRSQKHESITPILKSLHWLPIEKRIKFKIAFTTYKCINDQAPKYLQSLITRKTPSRNLRSSRSFELFRPVTKNKFLERSFSNAAPIIWNSLSTKTKNSTSLLAFKSNLKTELFKQHFGTS